ncbi:MAG: DNA polymerase III subunit delta [Bacteroidetes bacterium GWF2_43_63]|nr:MAG: DNA polymerase III subunit delta [Bacteroidetes bacterium GWE2_42_42]OFY52590.1 MAG: DNA polymerase III subunit delta [Bacteroidetes bacterium GWF2_43_63]HBG71500.1 DNA polymerase III subunit delta [Bacteroidales bacterium]HCB60748.1 DNA polymerase III subunit delta [Bacteroidales bacterium]HCY23527.1 DNA polymerase III subunit delta [Bacteroidales bacterium]
MTHTDIINEVNKKVFRPVYFLHGAEPYLIDVVSNHLANSILEPAEREFNQTVIYGRDANISDLVSTLKCFPMMSNYQVAILKEAQDVKDKEFEHLAAYIANPQPSSILVICYKKQAGKRLQTLFAKNPAAVLVFESPEIKEAALPDWIIKYLSQKKIVCTPKTAQIIVGSLGKDMSKIANELDKVMLNLPEGGTLTMDVVETNIGISKKYNVFELQSAITSNKKAKALEIANYFAANTKEVSLFAVIGILYSYFEKLFIYLQLGNSKGSAALAAEMGVKPFFLDQYKNSAAFYNMKKVLDVFKLLRSYDLKAKGVDCLTPESELMREMIYKIVHL